MFENDPPQPIMTPPPAIDLPAFEASAPTPAQPVPTVPVRPRGRIAGRWPIAALAVVLVATASFAAWRVLANQQSTVRLADWAPQNTVVYAEVRLVPSGEQHDNLAKFLAHFPTFGSSAGLDSGLANAYDQLIRRSSNGKLDYVSDIQPWFAGTVGIALTRLPDPADPGADPGVLLAADVKDQAAARAWLSKVLASVNDPTSVSTYAGTELLTAGKGSAAALSNVLLIGDTASVRTALDNGGSGGLSTTDEFTAAARATDTKNLGLFYVSGKGYMAWLTKAATSLATGSVTTCAAALAAVPDWYAGSVSADADAMTLRLGYPHSTVGSVTTNARSALAARLPSSTLFVADQHAVGTTVQKVVEQLGICGGSGQEMATQINAALEQFGGLAGLTGWIGESAIAIDGDGTGATPSGGVLIVPTNQVAAENLAALARQYVSSEGSGVMVSDESYAGVTLTLVGSGGSGLQLAYVVTDGLVAIGLESWVKKVLDTTAATSLAADPKFSAALGRASAENTQLLYANIAGLATLIRGQMPPSAVAGYDQDVAPYIAPLDTLIATSTVGGDIDTGEMVLTLK